VITAVLTAFYTGRQLGLTFFGKERTEEAHHAHESPLAMTLPLMILSIFAIIAGFVNIPDGVIPGMAGFHGLGHMLEHVHTTAGVEAYEPHDFSWVLALLTGGLGTLAFAGGIYMYAGRAVEPLRVLGPLWTAMENKWYVDELYKWIFIRPAVATSDLLRRVDADWIVDPIVNGAASLGRRFGGISNWLDRNIVDGTVNLVGIVMDEMSNYLKLLQTGRLQNYLVILLAGLLVLAGLYFR
jgi:NADH-quinone oxidoreductase subunit L